MRRPSIDDYCQARSLILPNALQANLSIGLQEFVHTYTAKQHIFMPCDVLECRQKGTTPALNTGSVTEGQVPCLEITHDTDVGSYSLYLLFPCRMLWSYARDGGVPLYKVWLRVSPVTETPINAGRHYRQLCIRTHLSQA